MVDFSELTLSQPRAVEFIHVGLRFYTTGALNQSDCTALGFFIVLMYFVWQLFIKTCITFDVRLNFSFSRPTLDRMRILKLPVRRPNALVPRRWETERKAMICMATDENERHYKATLIIRLEQLEYYLKTLSVIYMFLSSIHLEMLKVFRLISYLLDHSSR